MSSLPAPLQEMHSWQEWQFSCFDFSNAIGNYLIIHMLCRKRSSPKVCQDWQVRLALTATDILTHQLHAIRPLPFYSSYCCYTYKAGMRMALVLQHPPGKRTRLDAEWRFPTYGDNDVQRWNRLVTRPTQLLTNGLRPQPRDRLPACPPCVWGRLGMKKSPKTTSRRRQSYYVLLALMWHRSVISLQVDFSPWRLQNRFKATHTTRKRRVVAFQRTKNQVNRFIG